jgi:hypothetical protein
MARCFTEARGGKAAARALLPLLALLGSLSLLAALFVLAPGASGAIKIYETSEDAAYLGKFKRGSCEVRGKGRERRFRARSRTVEGGYRLKLKIDPWRGYRKDYDFRYGTSNPGEFHLLGIDGPFSNLNAPPGTTGLSSGGVQFSTNKKSRRMGVGFLPASNPDFSEGVVLAGAMRCR